MNEFAPEMVPVRLLIVEDDPNDDALLRRERQRAGFAPIGPRVETAPAATDGWSKSRPRIAGCLARRAARKTPSPPAMSTTRRKRLNSYAATMAAVSGRDRAVMARSKRAD
jgi:hypothetical protein